MQGAVKKIFCLLVICWISASVFADNSKAIANDFYQKAQKYEKSLYIFEARTAYQKALTLDPKNPGYLSSYAWLLHLYGLTEEAPAAFYKALANHPDRKYEMDMYKSMAWDQFFMGNLAESVGNFQHVWSSGWLKSNYRNAITEAGRLANKEITTKIKELKQKLALDPNNFELQKELFNSYRYHDEFSNAIALGSGLMDNKKTDNFTRLEFARTLFKNKQYDQAAVQYQQLMQQFPNNAFLAYDWGNNLVELRQYTAASQMFAQSLEYYPSSEAKGALAKLMAREKRCDDALNLLSQITDKDKYRAVYLLGMGDTYRECRQYAAANSYYQAVLEQHPYNSDALWGVISSTAAAHRYTGNRVAYDRWQEVYNWRRSLLQSQLVDYYQSPMIPLNGSYYDNSSTYRRSDVGAAYDFYAVANTRLNASYHYSTFAQDGFNKVFRNTFQLEGSKLFSEHWQVGAGVSNKKYSNQFNNINGDAWLKYTLSKNLNVTLNYKHLDIIDTEPPFGIQIYNYIIDIGAVGLNIKTNDYIGTIYYQATQRLGLWGRGIVGKYSDGNTKTQGSFDASYQIFDLPQVKLIYNYFYLNFAQPAPIFTQNNMSQSAYFDPISFQVHTGKIRVEHFFTKNLHAGIENGVSYFPQNGSFANAVASYVDYKIATHLAIRLAGQYYYQAGSVARTDSNTGSFWAKGVNLSLTYKF